ncbi:Oxoglutarate/iron-dependent dioxygenase [Parasponia andersonii]|uniref:Oxoglutarate/iron-dependent dioxygenase n=1 Tax=Parasponia andersonii TaxID=3476 RepID=A0A2P5C8N0_PARAD|nr:Oxoglutarate/iron-dependent dioxygenase [Parasponia andersonii]
MANSTIPTVDVSPFLKEGDENGKKRAIEVINQACYEYGFFRITNHGVPLGLMNQALDMCKEFFEYPDEEKLKSGPRSGGLLPAGYNRQPPHSADKNEYLVVCSPNSNVNVYPQNPPQFRKVLEDMFLKLTKMGLLVESILNECLGLPPNFLEEYNSDRSWDLMVAHRYFPATETENNGIAEHEDGNCFTFVFQDEVGGLEVCKNKEWIPLTPVQGTIVVNIGDVIQQQQNEEFNSQSGENKGKKPMLVRLFL